MIYPFHLHLYLNIHSIEYCGWCCYCWWCLWWCCWSLVDAVVVIINLFFHTIFFVGTTYFSDSIKIIKKCYRKSRRSEITFAPFNRHNYKMENKLLKYFRSLHNETMLYVSGHSLIWFDWGDDVKMCSYITLHMYMLNGSFDCWPKWKTFAMMLLLLLL